MTTAWIDWPNALVAGARYTPVLLVAGVPRVFTAKGVHPTTVSVSHGTIDTAFWPGTGSLAQPLPGALTFDPVRDLLDASQVFEVYEEARPADGDTRVEALTFDLYDFDGLAAAELSVREARLTKALTLEVSPLDTTIPLSSIVDVPSSGIAAIGRETIVYDGVGGSSLSMLSSPAGRGKFGSRARRHTAPASHLPLVSFGGPRHWQGRRAVLFVATLSTDGTTLTNPTPIFFGTVGAGVQLTRKGTRWSVPLDPISESFTRKWTPRTVDLYGFAHYYTETTQPLQVWWQANTCLTGESGAPNNGGWHSNFDSFIVNFRARALVTEGATQLVVNHSNHHLTLGVSGGGSSEEVCTVFAAWNTPPIIEQSIDGNGTITFSRDPPDTCLHLEGRVRIPRTDDMDQIPSTLSWSVTLPAVGNAYLALSCPTDHHSEPLYARILQRDAVAHEVTVRAQFAPSVTREVERTNQRQQLTLITHRTAATLSVIAEGETPLAALQALALALDEVSGVDLQDDSIDWSDLAREFARYPSMLTERREYHVDKGDTLLDLLVQECRLRGMSLAIKNGRISAYRPSSFASTEPVRATITKRDLLLNRTSGELEEWEVIDNNQPLASSVVFKLPDGGSMTWVDTTYQEEFGDGATIECSALTRLPAETDLVAVVPTLRAVALQLLGPLAEPSRIVRLPLPPTYLHLQPGDLVSLTHDMVPNWQGSRGVVDAVCQVTEVRRQLWGDKGRAVVALRLQSQDLAGYAPEALVAASGLNHASHTVTLDTVSGWGANCFARETDVNGAPITDPLDGYAVGDEVVLSELDNETPIADEPFTLSAVDPTAHTVTLSGFPSLAMAALAAAQYKVVLRFAPWSSTTTRQKAFAFIADDSTEVLGASDSPKRWAA